MGTSSSSAKRDFTPIQIREVPLTGQVGRLHFTKALIEVEPLGLLAVVHYSIDGKPQADGIALDLDKGIFLDACEEVDVSKMAAKIRLQIVAQLPQGRS